MSTPLPPAHDPTQWDVLDSALMLDWCHETLIAGRWEYPENPTQTIAPAEAILLVRGPAVGFREERMCLVPTRGMHPDRFRQLLAEALFMADMHEVEACTPIEGDNA